MSDWAPQFLRYGVVGVASNLVLYGVYLGATALGAAPAPAMTGVYVLGVMQTFVFNMRWTFRSTGRGGGSFWRYAAAYASGYALNYALLAVFAGRLGLDHRYVEGGAILAVAVYLFLVLRLWVFGVRVGA